MQDEYFGNAHCHYVTGRTIKYKCCSYGVWISASGNDQIAVIYLKGPKLFKLHLK